MNVMKNLSKSKINQFKKLFLDRQQSIINATLSRDNEVIDVEGGDEIDLVQGAMLKSMADKLSMRDKENLAKVRDALQRIENGTFGSCEECGEPIPEKRLTVLPDCRACIACTEQEERRIKQFRS
ncbi:MAG TPA: TraR/DksA family transcriptional regulator [Anaerovoracaceae bacterium]|nr:TraR/DksA family transcriptional regulator [Anaerovoracaceae bacterium]